MKSTLPSHKGAAKGALESIQDALHEDRYVQELFVRMGPTYGLMNLLSSFGFSELWRRQCVKNAGIRAGSRVCDMMSGSGECWRYVLQRGGSLVSIDFSPEMSERQRARNQKHGLGVEVRCENALETSLDDNSIDCVVGAFGLKTLSRDGLSRFASEVRRILKPGGRFSLLEISTAEGWLLSPLYCCYLKAIVPLIGKLCLADMDCYRMLGVYTASFGSCHRIVPAFIAAGLHVSVHSHFFGCATSLVGAKPTGGRIEATDGGARHPRMF